MHWLVILMMLTADPASGGAGNFARPKGEPPAGEKVLRPYERRERDMPKEERREPERTEAPVVKEPPREESRKVVEAPAATGPAARGGLSAYFGAELRPGDYGGIITALADRLNRQVLAGVSPDQEFERYRAAAKRMRGDGRDVRELVEQLYTNMVTYLNLEAEFAAKRSENVLRRASNLVEDQIGLDPNAEPERAEQLIQIMRANGTFPPASLFFGLQLLPYRPMKLPPGHVLLEVPVEPQYTDEEHTAQAVFDFLSSPGPVWRLDFESSRIGELTAEQSYDRKRFTAVETVKSEQPGGVQGPLLLKEPVKTRYLRLTGTGATEPPMLRNARAAALKGPAVAAVPAAPSAPVMDASFKEEAYPRHAEVVGFVNSAANRFAEESSEVRLCHTADALVIGAYIRDSRMKTLVATQTQRDAQVDEEESFEVRLRPTRGDELRFVVNALGTQFDARGNDVSWNGEWEAVTKNYSTGWAVEIRIPYATLGVQPRAGATMPANFLRHRRNVTGEDSTWSLQDNGPGWGTLAFD